MGAIGTLNSWNPGDVIKSAEMNSNFSDIKTAFNTFAVLTDTAKTITVTHTFSASQTFSGGLTVSSGTAAVQALTAAGVATFSDDVVAGTLRRGTGDGSDNSLIRFAGGGAYGDTRGATMALYGNEHASTGLARIDAGNVSGGMIQFHTDGTERARIAAGVLIVGTTSAGAAAAGGIRTSGKSQFGSGSASITPVAENVAILHNVAGDINSGSSIHGNIVELTQSAAAPVSHTAWMVSSEATHATGTVTQLESIEAFTVLNGAGTVSELWGIRALCDIKAGVATEAACIRCAGVLDTGGAITTAYGIKIDAITTGTTNYAIHTAGGNVRFQSLPTSASGLATGTLWNNSGVVNVA